MAWVRRVVSGLVLAAIVVAVVLVARSLRAQALLPSAWEAAVGVLAVVAGAVLDPYRRWLSRWFDRPRARRAAVTTHLRLLDARGRVRRVRDCADPLALGVHRPEDGPDEDARLPSYVRRDADAALDEAIAAGGLVILQGRSTAGKTRTAYEAMHRVAGDRWLVVPATVTALRDLDADAVGRPVLIWLDDLHRYLRSGGLDAAVLDRWCPTGCRDVSLLATIPSHEVDQLEGEEIARSFQQLRDRARSVIAIGRELSDDESHRAEEVAAVDRERGDRRIAEAVAHAATTGLAEYLAAGPAAWERWQRGREDDDNVVAWAVVKAAVDARRAGWLSPLPAALLDDLHRCYPHRGARVPAMDLTAALRLAGQEVNGATGCLVRVEDDGYAPFDYLVDREEGSGSTSPVPEALRELLLAAATHDEDVFSLGFGAYHAQSWTVSETAFRRLAVRGDLDSMTNLGAVLQVTGHGEEAEHWHRRAADAGSLQAMNNLAVLFRDSDRYEEAEQWFRRAADSGLLESMTNLGTLLHISDRDDEAKLWLHRAATGGHPRAMAALGLVFHGCGPYEEAERWYRRAADAGRPEAAYNLGLLLEELGRGAEAEGCFRQAAEGGELIGMFAYARRLRDTGREEQAERWFRAAAEAGELDAMNDLGVLLRATGRQDEGERWHRLAAERGGVKAMTNLGALLLLTDRDKEALAWFLRAAAAGDLDAMNNLGVLSREYDRRSEAERWLRRAAAAGHVGAMLNLAVLLSDSGREAEGDAWLRRAAEATSEE